MLMKHSLASCQSMKEEAMVGTDHLEAVGLQRLVGQMVFESWEGACFAAEAKELMVVVNLRSWEYIATKNLVDHIHRPFDYSCRTLGVQTS